jgi:hypothetical protein
MLHRDDIPFGARALESGIAIEGIWVSNSNTPVHSPCQPTTPVGSRPASPALRPLSKAIESPKSSLGSECTLISPRPVAPADRRGVLSQLDLASAGFSYESKQYALSSPVSLPSNPNALRMSPAQEEKLVSGKDTTRSQRRASFHTRIFSSSRHSEVKGHSVGSDGTDETDPASTENKRVSRFTRKTET